eukprot:6607661-Pyramimonas_sp.AAC.2
MPKTQEELEEECSIFAPMGFPVANSYADLGSQKRQIRTKTTPSRRILRLAKTTGRYNGQTYG